MFPVQLGWWCCVYCQAEVALFKFLSPSESSRISWKGAQGLVMKMNICKCVQVGQTTGLLAQDWLSWLAAALWGLWQRSFSVTATREFLGWITRTFGVKKWTLPLNYSSFHICGQSWSRRESKSREQDFPLIDTHDLQFCLLPAWILEVHSGSSILQKGIFISLLRYIKERKQYHYAWSVVLGSK